MNVRELASQDLPALNSLVSKSFGYTPPHSFFDDFPVWKLGDVTRLGLFDGTTLIAHVGLRFANMQTSSGLVKVALIGAVATHENYRRKGLSTQLLQEALSRADQTDAEWSLLWGSEHEFYAKLGFQLCGDQYRTFVSDLSISPQSALIQIHEGFTEEIFQSMLRSKNGIQITEKDRAWVFAHKTVNWFWTKSPFAYVGYERGMDLNHMIHEFGGDARGLEAIFANIYLKDHEAQVLLSKSQLSGLEVSASDLVQESLCLARPKNAFMKWNSDFWVQGLGAC